MTVRVDELSDDDRDWLRRCADRRARPPEVVETVTERSRAGSLVRTTVVAIAGLALAMACAIRLAAGAQVMIDNALLIVGSGLAAALSALVLAAAHARTILRAPVTPTWIVTPHAVVHVTWSRVRTWPLRGAADVKVHLSKGGASLSFRRGPNFESIGFGSPLLGGLTWADAGVLGRAVAEAAQLPPSGSDARFARARTAPSHGPWLAAIGIAVASIAGTFVFAHVRRAQAQTIVRTLAAEDGGPSTALAAAASGADMPSARGSASASVGSPPPASHAATATPAASSSAGAARTRASTSTRVGGSSSSATRPASPKTRSLAAGISKVDGGLPREIVNRIVHANMGRFRGCATTASGQLAVRLVIDRAGNVASARAERSQVPSDVAACLVRSVSAMAFPATEGGTVSVEVTFTLRG
jgi:hypothetical protein